MNTLPPPQAPQPTSRRKWLWVGAGLFTLTAAVTVGTILEEDESNDTGDEVPATTEAPTTTVDQALIEAEEALAEAEAERDAAEAERDAAEAERDAAEAERDAAQQAPPPPPPADDPMLSDSDQWDLAYELWLDTGYCYTDCSRLYDPSQWLAAAEGYGFYTVEEVLMQDAYFASQPVGEMDTFCDGFWSLPDSEMANIANSSGISPGAFILTSYIWCDS